MVDTLLSLAGEIERDVAALFIEQLAGLEREDAPIVVDLEEAEIEDATVAATLVEHLRQTAARVGTVRLLRPPQILAHALYRVGAPLGASIQLVEPREELGPAS